MDQTPADLEREIAEIRAETELIIDELERRGRRLFDVRRIAEAHPAVAVAFIASLILVIGLVTFGFFMRRRPRPGPRRFVDRAGRWLRDRLPITVAITTTEVQPRRWQRPLANTLLERLSGVVMGVATAVVTRLAVNALLPRRRLR